MKFSVLMFAMLLCGSIANAQNDPVVMTINGHPVTRSEFEYSYNKNNSETVVDKKSVDEYVDLFINYKLKVQAAMDAGIDTTKSFRSEFLLYRNQQIRPSFINNTDIENEAWKIYKATQTRVDSLGGLVRPAHILVGLRQNAPADAQAKAKERIDSIYNALQGGADFAELARKCSDDRRSAVEGGLLPWLQKGQTLKEFEDVIFSLKKGEMSKPFLSPAGYHIVLLEDKSKFFPYDSIHADIVRFIDQRGVRERIITQNIDSIAKASVPQMTPDEVLDKRAAEMEASDPDLKNLIREYHDGLLLYEISNRTVWEKAATDEKGLERMFKKNKKKYRWDSPRYKGIAYYVKDEADVQAVKDVLKKVDFKDWADTLRHAFNDSTIRIKVVKGIFKKGDNALIDKVVFGKDSVVTPPAEYPIPAVYGKLLKSPKSYEDVRELVVTDYQEQLEEQWVADLRKKYAVTVDKSVLATVNKH